MPLYDSDEDEDDKRLSRDYANPKRRRGWEGEQLELEHSAASKTKRSEDSSNDVAGNETVVAVDLNQFRNTVVGQGYQAKHVVRQKGLPVQQVAASVAAPDRGVTTKVQLDSNDGTTRKSTTTPTENHNQQAGGPASKLTRLETYLQCAGLRKFRKELAKIEASS